MLKFNKFYFSWKTLQTLFWNSSPVSSVVANLAMEDDEKRALGTFTDPPRLRKRYVDDT